MIMDGLPEGVEAVRWGTPEEGEYAASSFGGVYPADAAPAIHCLIVKPSDGYVFRYDIENDNYRACRSYPQPKTVTAAFQCSTDEDVRLVRQGLEQCRVPVVIEE